MGEENVLETQQLIFEALESDPNQRESIIDKVVDFEELPSSFKKKISAIPNKRLAEILTFLSYFLVTIIIVLMK